MVDRQRESEKHLIEYKAYDIVLDREHILIVCTRRIIKMKKKILFVTAGGIEHGGVEKFLLSWIQNAPENAYEFSWYFPGIIKSEYLKRELEKKGVVLISGNDCNKRGTIIGRKNIGKDLWMIIRGSAFDIIHINTGSIGIQALSLVIAKKMGIPIRIAHSHNSMGEVGLLREFGKTISRFVINRTANKCLACSQKAAEYLFGKHNVKKVELINNCIDTKRFSFSESVRSKRRISLGLERCFVIGNVGRFEEQKNHNFLIDIFRCVIDINKDARLLLVGDGSLLNGIKKKINNYGLAEKVVFVGITDAVEEYLCAMDVFVMPSLYEGLPIAGIEAQSCGLPCVFSDTISRDIQLTEKCVFLPLDKPPSQWGRELLGVANNITDDFSYRVNAHNAIINKGYDVMDYKTLMNRVYCEVINT